MRIDGKFTEKCAVFGVSLNIDEAAGVTYNGLLSLQHRGQEGAGIAVASDNNIVCHKDMGLVSEIFDGTTLENLPKDRVAVGHTPYSLRACNKRKTQAPFVEDTLPGG